MTLLLLLLLLLLTHILTYLHTYLLIYLFTAIELSLGGKSPYTSTYKTNKNKYYVYINETIQKTQYKQYKTQ